MTNTKKNVLELPKFLDRRTNGIVPVRAPFGQGTVKQTYVPLARTQCQREIDKEKATASAQGPAIELRELEGDNVFKITWQKTKGVRLSHGTQKVELVRLGHKWVYFKPNGRNNAIRVTRDKWDEIVERKV